MPRITISHHDAFYLFFLLTFNTEFCVVQERLTEVPEYAEMRHAMVVLLLNNNEVDCIMRR